ncbi:phosphatidyl serine synthase [Toxoplasma gondii p89]|uniref:Phosphatidyl serine synthase n=1 Tax=Toxoplasma gondii p89 TaxID=943119 RepID=A0A086K5E7_TOXGO|nr:phosphatidyl serine synthase [Toxoplasma gondii p89]
MCLPQLIEKSCLSSLCRPKTVSTLCTSLVIIFVASQLVSSVSEPESLRWRIACGSVAAVSMFLIFGTLQFPDGLLVRPTPIFWRFIKGCSVLYLVLLVFLLFQDLDDVRRGLRYIDPNLGKPLPEKSYAQNCHSFSTLATEQPQSEIAALLSLFLAVALFTVSFPSSVALSTAEVAALFVLAKASCVLLLLRRRDLFFFAFFHFLVTEDPSALGVVVLVDRGSMDVFVLAHFFGWLVKALIIRDARLLWILSVLFEWMEISLRHILPNFWECWWDHLILDVFGCNLLGMYLGLALCRRFQMKEYFWHDDDSLVSASCPQSSLPSPTSSSCRDAREEEIEPNVASNMPSSPSSCPENELRSRKRSASPVRSRRSGCRVVPGSLRQFAPYEW